MVSPQDNPASGVAPNVVVTDRGFIPPEEIARQPIALVRSHVSWGSVIAGSLLCLALLTLSASLAYACGVPAYVGTGVYGWGAGAWSIVTAVIVFFCGGWLSAYLSAATDQRYSVLHGIMAWALTIPLVLFFLGGNFVGNLNTVGGTMANDVRFMTLFAHRVGPAWGAWVSLACGLIFAAIGGAMAIMPGRRRV